MAGPAVNISRTCRIAFQDFTEAISALMPLM
jgi:hypothetical protein